MGWPVERDSNHADEMPDVLDWISEIGIHLRMHASIAVFKKSDINVSG